MNAKMVITVPIENIPKEVNKVFDNISNELENIINETRQLVDSHDYLSTLEKIDNLRKKLMLLDLNYEDCYGILQGYIKYQMQKNNSNNDSKIKETNSERNTNG